MVQNGQKTGESDFNPDSMVQEHQKDISDLKERIKALEDKFSTHEKIADTLCETAEKQTKMFDMLSVTFLKLLKNNTDIRDEFKKIIKECDRDFFHSFSSKIGIAAWSIILIIVTAIVTKLIH
jgi:hypothetical protein